MVYFKKYSEINIVLGIIVIIGVGTAMVIVVGFIVIILVIKVMFIVFGIKVICIIIFSTIICI